MNQQTRGDNQDIATEAPPQTDICLRIWLSIKKINDFQVPRGSFRVLARVKRAYDRRDVGSV
jgi:hypothetical protein